VSAGGSSSSLRKAFAAASAPSCGTMRRRRRARTPCGGPARARPRPAGRRRAWWPRTAPRCRPARPTARGDRAPFGHRLAVVRPYVGCRRVAILEARDAERTSADRGAWASATKRQG
jgi:hypothetical protein